MMCFHRSLLSKTLVCDFFCPPSAPANAQPVARCLQLRATDIALWAWPAVSKRPSPPQLSSLLASSPPCAAVRNLPLATRTCEGCDVKEPLTIRSRILGGSRNDMKQCRYLVEETARALIK